MNNTNIITDSNIAEDAFWGNELDSYIKFKASHKNDGYDLFFPEKAYPALRTVYLFEKLFSLKSSRILEPGCGMGLILCYLAQRGACVTGIDTSPNAIKHSELIKDEMSNLDGEIQLFKQNFFDYGSNDTYDMVFNSGVLEHFNIEDQSKFLKRMIHFSKKYICIIVPNTKSPVFKALINKLSSEDRKYEEEHRIIDVEQLFRDNDVRLVVRSGRNLWVTNHNKVADISIQNLYRKYFYKFMNRSKLLQEDVYELARIESEIDDETLFNHSFSQIYVGEISK